MKIVPRGTLLTASSYLWTVYTSDAPLYTVFSAAIFSVLSPGVVRMSVQTLKRKVSSSAEPASKRRSDSSAPSSEPLSALEQAAPHRLVTAIFPIGVLTPVWKQGTNRPLNVPHRRRLYEAFRKELRRTDPNNALRLLCTQQEVNRMTAELERRGDTRTDWTQRTPSAWPSFLDWHNVNQEPVELMAGHHRVEALKEYLKDQKAKDEGWWLCDVYNQGGSECLGTTPLVSRPKG
jgi:hypothetical protein